MIRTSMKLARSSSRPDMDEPVRVAGQAPVEPKRRLLQVKRIENNTCRRRKWVETLEIGKEMTHIMAIVRSLRLDFRCFGAVPAASSSSYSSSEEEEDIDHDGFVHVDDESKDSAAGLENNDGESGKSERVNESEDQESHVPSLSQDAHVIKRCVSAPAKGWQTLGDDQGKEEEARKAGQDRGTGDSQFKPRQSGTERKAYLNDLCTRFLQGLP